MVQEVFETHARSVSFNRGLSESSKRANALALVGFALFALAIFGLTKGLSMLPSDEPAYSSMPAERAALLKRFVDRAREDSTSRWFIEIGEGELIHVTGKRDRRKFEAQSNWRGRLKIQYTDKQLTKIKRIAHDTDSEYMELQLKFRPKG